MKIVYQTVVLIFLLAAQVSSYAQNAVPATTSGTVPGTAPATTSVNTPRAAPGIVPVKPGAAAPVNYGHVKDSVAELIKQEMRKNDVVGLSIALVDDQQVVWVQGFGYADEGKEIAATPDTVYRAGTLTRLFTAAAVMQLAEQGKLDIDRPLKEYVPEFSVKTRFTGGGQITLRNLMTNHAGLPSRVLKGMWTKNPEPFTKVLDQIRDEYVAYPPGFIFSNSDLGFTLLGIALQKVSRQDFVSHIEEALLKPLNMVHSLLLPAPGKNQLKSKSYYKGRETDEPLSRDIPAYGLQSTVIDLSRFMQMIFAQGRFGTRQVLKPETVSEMLRVQNSHIALDFGLQTGIGWMLSGFGEINLKNAGPVARFSGASLLHRSQMIILPAQKLGVVVMANTSAGSTVNMVATRALILALEMKTGIKQVEPKKAVEVDTPLPNAVMQSYEGRYATMFGVGNVTRNSDHFETEIMDRSFHLIPHADGTFGVRYQLFSFIPIRLRELDYVSVVREEVAGREVLVINNRGRELLVGEKIKPVPLSAAWQKRAGDYVIENLGNDYPLVDTVRLRLDNGLLLVEFSLPLLLKNTMTFALQPLSDSEAIIYGLGSGMAETIRVITVGGREELYYCGFLIRKK